MPFVDGEHEIARRDAITNEVQLHALERRCEDARLYPMDQQNSIVRLVGTGASALPREHK